MEVKYMKKIISILLALSIIGKKTNQVEIAYNAGNVKIKHADLIYATATAKDQIMQDLKSDGVIAAPLSMENLTEQYLSLNPKILKTFAAVLYRNIPSVLDSEKAEGEGIYEKPAITDEENRYRRFLSVFISLSDINSKDIDLWRTLPLVQEFEKTLNTILDQNENKSLDQIVKSTIIDHYNKIKNAAPAMMKKLVKGLDILTVTENTLFTTPLETFNSQDSAKIIHACLLAVGKKDNQTLGKIRDQYMEQIKHVSMLYDALLEKFNAQIRDEFKVVLSEEYSESRHNVSTSIAFFANELSCGNIFLTDDVSLAMLKIIKSISMDAILKIVADDNMWNLPYYDTSSSDWIEANSVLRNISLKNMIISQLKSRKEPAAIINQIANNKDLDNIKLDEEFSGLLYNIIDTVITHERAKNT